MNELIRTDIDTQTVSARDLHERLNIKTAFKDWFPRMASYGFIEGEDYNLLKFERVQIEGDREVRREVNDYSISIDMAKQICMIQRTPEGKQVRQYLLDLEKAWNTPELIMARALKVADKQIMDLKVENENLVKHNTELIEENTQLAENVERTKPLVEFSKTVGSSPDSIHIGNFAKLIGVGQNTMFGWLRQNGYLGKNGSSYNIPVQKYLNMGIFTLKENIVTDKFGNSVIYPPTPLVTGKGQVYLYDKYNQSQWQQANLMEM